MRSTTRLVILPVRYISVCPGVPAGEAVDMYGQRPREPAVIVSALVRAPDARPSRDIRVRIPRRPTSSHPAASALVLAEHLYWPSILAPAWQSCCLALSSRTSDQPQLGLRTQ